MTSSRRDVLRSLGALAAGVGLPRLDLLAATTPVAASREDHAMTTDDFPRKADFNIARGETYLSGAYTHPMPIASAMRLPKWGLCTRRASSRCGRTALRA